MSKQKQDRNDLNSQMFRILPAVFYIILSVTLLASACRNQDKVPPTSLPSVESNPLYKSLNDSIRNFPAESSLFLRRAIRLSQENQHELANDDFQKAWNLTPTLENALPYAANLDILGKHMDRLKLLEKLNQLFPTTPQVGRLLADAYTISGQTARALNIYDRMIMADTMDPETLYEKALLLEQLKDTSGAIAALQKAYHLQGIDTYGLELANLYAEQKNPRALEICNFILRQDSAKILIDPLFIKGIYYANIKQYLKAIAAFDSCILRDWKTTDAYLEKGRIYFQMGDFNTALQTFHLAVTVTNTDPDAYYWLGRCYEAMHQKMDAVSNYQKAIALDVNFIEAKKRKDSLVREFAHPSH